MTVLTTLSAAGTGTGPFDLYTSINGTTFTLLVSGIQKSVLVGQGYSSSAVPNGSTKIRVTSTSVSCPTSIDLTITSTSSSTSSTSSSSTSTSSTSTSTSSTSTSTSSTSTSTSSTTTAPLSLCSLPDVNIEDMIWLPCNLNVETYRDGTPIPQVTDQAQWDTLKTGAWCYYDNNSANGPIYGKLYNWYAFMGIHTEESVPPTLEQVAARKNIAPLGYRIPYQHDWEKLYWAVNRTSSYPYYTGKMLKATGTIGSGGLWTAYTPSPGEANPLGTNTIGFTALPGGVRYRGYPAQPGYPASAGYFNELGNEGLWWAAKSYDVQIEGWATTASVDWLSYWSPYMGIPGGSIESNRHMGTGASIRLLKENSCFFTGIGEVAEGYYVYPTTTTEYVPPEEPQE